MQGFLEVLRIEHLKKGLHVLIACPGFTTSNIRNVALTADGSAQGEILRTESYPAGADAGNRSGVREKRIFSAIRPRRGLNTFGLIAE